MNKSNPTANAAKSRLAALRNAPNSLTQAGYAYEFRTLPAGFGDVLATDLIDSQALRRVGPLAHVTIVDYGLGNLLSVRRAFEHCGATVTISHSPLQVEAAPRLVLPGVGAFAKGMAGLRHHDLDRAIQAYALTNRPLLGICLGMQLLLDESDEFGTHKGLGLIPGRVVAIPPKGLDGSPHPIPHIGWNSLSISPALPSWRNTLLDGVANGSHCYFVHSFTAVPHDDTHRLADCHYNGLALAAAIHRGQVTGCQFHPEKSGEVGLRIIHNFIKM